MKKFLAIFFFIFISGCAGSKYNKICTDEGYEPESVSHKSCVSRHELKDHKDSAEDASDFIKEMKSFGKEDKDKD